MRKGAFFTLTAILLGILAVMFTVSFIDVSDVQDDAIHVRIITLNGFLIDATSDLERALEIASIRSVLSFSDLVATTGSPVDDASAAIEEAIVGGFYNGSQLGLMQNTSMSDWESRMNYIANQRNVNVSVNVYDISAAHVGPWTIGVNMTAELSVADLQGLASFSKEVDLQAIVNIIGFEDPFYSMHTLARVVNTINITPYSDFVVNNDTANLLAHTQGGYYVAHNGSPTYLMRLEQNYSGHEFGIESLVYVPAISAQDVGTYQTTAVDYLYFQNSTVSSNAIQGMPSWFEIDVDHHEFYQVDGITE